MPQPNISADAHASLTNAPDDFLSTDEQVEPPLLLGGHTPDEIARARKNIAEWSEYLPADCVRLMIAQGWHWSVQR